VIRSDNVIVMSLETALSRALSEKKIQYA